MDGKLERSASVGRLSTLSVASRTTGRRLRRCASGDFACERLAAAAAPNPLGTASCEQAASWGALRSALLGAFERSSSISAEHPAAAALAAADTASLLDALRAPHARWVEGQYTRNVVLEGDGFVAMLLCWSAGACSPVHAHSDAATAVRSNCFMSVLEGELTETTWADEHIDRAAGRVHGPGTARTLAAGARAYINDELGVHKVGNASRTPALSLHVYAPLWKSSPMFDERPVEQPVDEPTDASGAAFDAEWGDF